MWSMTFFKNGSCWFTIQGNLLLLKQTFVERSALRGPFLNSSVNRKYIGHQWHYFKIPSSHIKLYANRYGRHCENLCEMSQFL